MRQFACSRPAKVASYADKCPVKFLIWTVDNSKKALGHLSPFMVIAVGHSNAAHFYEDPIHALHTLVAYFFFFFKIFTPSKQCR